MLSSAIVREAAAQSSRYLAPLGEVPDWSLLDPYQRTITRAEFEQELIYNYTEWRPEPEPEPEPAPDPEPAAEGASPGGEEDLAPGDGAVVPETPPVSEEADPAEAPKPEPPKPYWAKFIDINEERARIVTNSRRPDEDPYDLYFADEDEGSKPKVRRFWRSIEELPPAKNREKPLEGVRILVDAGHIGGNWAQMEERWVRIKPKEKEELETAPAGAAGSDGQTPAEVIEGELPLPEPEIPKPDVPVKEGEITLRVAELLEKKLATYGASVALVRRQTKPVTDQRPEDFYDHVREVYGLPADSKPEDNYRLRKTSERLFYLTAEIRARAEKINKQYRPDLVLCLHVNAEAWGNPADPDFVNRNHFHMLVNGCYSEGELLQDDQRFDMLLRLLQRIHKPEVAMSDTVAAVMAQENRLPPYTYTRSNARSVSDSPFVWSRNLLASRTYLCPVLFFEPYVMNHEQVYNRVQAGEYPGTKEFDGIQMVNIYEEYANSVTLGLVEYFQQNRTYQEAK